MPPPTLESPSTGELFLNSRQLLEELAHLLDSTENPSEFHAQFLTRVVSAIGARGGVLSASSVLPR